MIKFCKNIVLAGVGSLALMDDMMVTEDSLHANFLIPPEELKQDGNSLAEICRDSLREFIPMVQVSVEKGDPTQFDGEFFDKFNVVVFSCCSLNNKKSINEKCRQRQKRVAFYSVDCRGSCGEIFVDLHDYTYEQAAVSVPWRDLPRRMTKLFFAIRVIEKFESLEGRSPGDTSTSDLPVVLKLWKETCDAHSMNEAHIPTSLLERLLAAGRKEHPPVCAILGGILGQEVIKAVSGKGDPLKNFFYFDASDGRGVIEDISPHSADTNGQH